MDLLDLPSAIDLAGNFRKERQETSVLVEECFEKIEKPDPKLNVYLTLNEESTLERTKIQI